MVTMCIHWLSIDSAITKIIIKSLKIPKFDSVICGQANGLWTLRQCPVVGIFLSLPYQDCWRNVTKNVR